MKLSNYIWKFSFYHLVLELRVKEFCSLKNKKLILLDHHPISASTANIFRPMVIEH